MKQQKILVVTTTWWPSAARLALAFRDHGAAVSAICPRGNPVRVLSGIVAIHAYSALSPLDALTHAIKAQAPDIVVPTDDRAVRHLHALHASTASDDLGGGLMRTLIERSLGAPEGFTLSGTRNHLLQAVQAVGGRVPVGRSIDSADDLVSWFEAFPGRCVIKSEGSWGGSGVAIIETLEAAEAAFVRMSQPLTFRHALRLLLIDRDPFPFAQFLRRERRRVTVQAFIDGRRANIMAAAWKGRVLGTLSVDVLKAQNDVGAATVIKIVDCPEMEVMAGVVARLIGASGFFGLDFMIEGATGLHYLIEMNPRATQLGHLVWSGSDLVSMLLAAMGQTPLETAARAGMDRVIALFPQALWFDAHWLEKNRTWIDVPSNEPGLVAELLDRPWTKRSLLSRLESWLRHNPAYGRVLGKGGAVRLLASVSAQQSLPRMQWQDNVKSSVR